jgi:NADPH-dependent 7-cyano-7-deazaguanine reductase QueF
MNPVDAPHFGVTLTAACEALCPFAPESDLHEITVRIKPGPKSIEAQSFADYLATFALERVSAEDLVARIAGAAAQAIGKVGDIAVETEVTVAGGTVKLSAIAIA